MTAQPFRAEPQDVTIGLVVTADDLTDQIVAMAERQLHGTGTNRQITVYGDNTSGTLTWGFLNAHVNDTIPDVVWEPVPAGATRPVDGTGSSGGGLTTPAADTIPYLSDVNGGDANTLAVEHDYSTSDPDTLLAFFTDVPSTSPFASYGTLADEWDFSTLSTAADGSVIPDVRNRVPTSPLAREKSNVTGTPPVVKNAAINGVTGGSFSAANTLQAGDETTSAVQTQPFVVAAVLAPTAVSTTPATVLTTGTGSSNHNLLTFDTASGYRTYSGTPGGTGGLSSGSGNAPTTAPHILVCSFDGTSSVIRLDGVAVATAPGTFATSGRQMVRIGDPAGTKPLTAYLGHLLIYQGNLASVNVSGLESALASKWGITLSHAYTATAADTVGVTGSVDVHPLNYTAAPAGTVAITDAVSASTALDPSAYDPVAALPWTALFWADASNMSSVTNGTAVTTWSDASGNANNATQATSANRPIMNRSVAGWNNRSVVTFDGTNDNLATAAFSAAVTQPDTLIVIGKVTTLPAAGQNWFIAGLASGATTQQLGVTPTTWQITAGSNLTRGTSSTGKHLILGLVNNTSSQVTVDGVATTVGTAGTNTLAGMHLGSNQTGGGAYLTGDIALVGVVPRALTTTEAANLLAWSQYYYATP